MAKKAVPLLLIILIGVFVLRAVLFQGDRSIPETSADDTDNLSIVATTYPVYLFASEVTRDVEGVTVTPMINQDLSCLHDYTLTVNDMKLLEGADIIIMNGAGLDDFILDAAHSNPNLEVIDCSVKMDLVYYQHAHDHSDDHDHDHADEAGLEIDPHYWMDPYNAVLMLETISSGLCSIDRQNAEQYEAATTSAVVRLQNEIMTMMVSFEGLENRNLITFHDGFGYFAQSFGLDILMAIEEEEGQEASAQVIASALTLIETYDLPAIFTEVNSSDATAQAIARETDVTVYTLTMIMSGDTDDPGIAVYMTAMNQNIDTILEALS